MTVTKKQWGDRKAHEVTLPSGATVKIQIPNLPQMMKGGKIPNPLIEVSVQTASITHPSQITPELLVAQWDYYAFLVSVTVVSPAVTPEEVGELPFEDVEMLVEFATRVRETDATGAHIGGVELVSSFRELGDF